MELYSSNGLCWLDYPWVVIPLLVQSVLQHWIRICRRGMFSLPIMYLLKYICWWLWQNLFIEAIIGSDLCSLMRTLSQSKFKHLGYMWRPNVDPYSSSWLQFADDTAIIANDVKSAQTLINLNVAWCKWTGMHLRIDKCVSVLRLISIIVYIWVVCKFHPIILLVNITIFSLIYNL